VIIKGLVVLMLLAVLCSLGSALFYLVRGRHQDGASMLQALSWRIGLSLGVLLFLGVAYLLGWITPHAI
jgi:hypothetical protein